MFVKGGSGDRFFFLSTNRKLDLIFYFHLVQANILGNHLLSNRVVHILISLKGIERAIVADLAFG